MSTPADRHPIDPISQALGHLEGRFDQFEKQIADRFDAVADRFTGLEERIATLRSEMRTLIAGLYVLLAAGLTVVGWLVTRR